MQVLLTGGTLVQLIFWTILLAWLVLSADTITVMQLCCCCAAAAAVVASLGFFPALCSFLGSPPSPAAPGLTPSVSPTGSWAQEGQAGVCHTDM